MAGGTVVACTAEVHMAVATEVVATAEACTVAEAMAKARISNTIPKGEPPEGNYCLAPRGRMAPWEPVPIRRATISAIRPADHWLAFRELWRIRSTTRF